MKKLYLLFVLLLSSIGMSAQNFEVDGIKYSVVSATDLTVEVTGYNSQYEGDLVINGTVFYIDTEYKVVSIKGSNWLPSSFSQCMKLKSIGNLPYCTSIGDRAFYGCTNLLTVGDLNACESLGHFAFQACTSLTSIGDLSDCESIGTNVFDGCSSLTSFGDLSSCESIGVYAFRGCSSLTSVGDLSFSTSVPDGVFQNCSSLTSFGDLSSCTSIGQNAFSGCSSLTSVGDLSSCTSVGTNAFNGCSSLTGIIDLSSCTSIGQNAFSGCSSLTSFGDLSSCTSIGTNAFNGMESCPAIIITSTTIPTITGSIANLSVILVPQEMYSDYQSAEGWKDLTNVFPIGTPVDCNVTITANDGSSALHAAIGENNLQGVVKLKVTGAFNSYDVMIMRNKMINLRYLDLTDANIVTNDYEYYSGCHSENNIIGNNMFRDLKLISVKLPQNITKIGDYAFSGCSALKVVEIQEGLKVLGEWAFSRCSCLAEISLPEGMEDIRSFAFYDCPIKEITIPEGIKILRMATLGNSGYVLPLERIHLPSSLEVMEISCIGNMNTKHSLTELILPTGLKRIEGPLGKNSVATSVHIPPMVEYIADNAFSGWEAVTDYYVYVVDPISVNMNTFANYTTSTLHVPTQSYNNYYWNTQWSQFANLTEFDEPYESFYLNNDFTLAEDKRFDGVPNAIFKKNSGFIVEGNDSQDLDEVHVISDGTDAASIIDDGNISVNNLYYDITIVANRWYFFSFPFRVKCSDIVAPGYYALRYYDGEERANNGSGGWKDYTGEYMEPGVGYIFQCNTAGTLSVPVTNPVFDGEDKDCSLTMYRSDNDQHASWNFIGNPCSSYYNIDDCGYDAPLTIWNGSGYDAYRPGDDEYLLHPFQAFFTQKPEDSSSLQFESDSRCTYQQGQKQQNQAKASRMMKGINPDRLFINLTVSDGINSDRTRVVFNDKKADAYELGTDAAKFLTSSIPQIYSIDGTKVRYAINERPQGEVKLGFNAPKAGTYTIAAVRMDMPMLLRDLETNTTISLSDKDYTFESKAGLFDDRFVLTVDNSATGVAQLQKETGTSVIGADNGLYISGISDNSATIYNTSGAIVAQNVGNGFMPLATGIYIVKVNGKSAKVGVR